MRNYLSQVLTIHRLIQTITIIIAGLMIGFFGVAVALADGDGKCAINSPDGIDLHVDETADGRAYVVCIDLTDPYIRFETVMANDSDNVNAQPIQRERVESMATRQPYTSQGVLVGFNADYFGDKNPNKHGPEGLTIKNGTRLDGPHSNDKDQNETRRPSLSVSRVNEIDLRKKDSASVTSQPAQLTRLFNSVGGAPTLVRDGAVIANPCSIEGGDCTKAEHTAVGVTQDGHTFIIIVSERQMVGEDIGRLIRSYGAYQAIQLDGGGSSQLWYRGETKSNGDGRGIADAILVFREQNARHDAVRISQSQFPIVKPGEKVTLKFELENLGFLPWLANNNYGLRLIEGDSMGLAQWTATTTEVPPGVTPSWEMNLTAPQQPGAYVVRWRMAYHDSTTGFDEPFGDEIGFVVTVLPEGSSTDLAEVIRQIVAQAGQQAQQQLGQFLDDLQKQIEERIQDELRKNLPPWTQCATGVGVVFGSTAIAGLYGYKRSKHKSGNRS